MEHHVNIPYLQEIVVFLIAAGVIVPMLHRLRISPVLGFLLIGGIVGPHGLGLLVEEYPFLSYAVISDIKGVHALAELGVVFLLFMIGLEISLERLWSMRRMVFGLGSLQILVTGAIIAFIAWQWGNPVQASVVLGAGLALSSTAIVMQLLIHSRRQGTPVGRAGFSILLMQDLAVVPILFVVGFMGAQVDGPVALEFGYALAKAVLAIALVFGLGRLLLRPAFRYVAQSRSPEMFMAAVLLTVIGVAAITGVAGLSMALGAFMAGMLLGETEYRHEVEVDIEPFKGLMLGLFFMSVGMEIDWRLIGAQPFWIPALVIVLFALKSTVIALLCLLFKLPRHTAVETGLLLGQGGEFSLIVIGMAMGVGLLGPDVGQFMLIVTGLAMLVTPLVAIAAQKLAVQMELNLTALDQDKDIPELRGLEGHIIFAGFGRVGHTVAGALQAEKIPYIAIDSDPDLVDQGRRSNLPVYFGDASRLEMLYRTRIDHALAVVVTMNDPDAAEDIVQKIRRTWPDVPIHARARDTAHASRLLEAGANSAIPETIEASLQLAGRVLSGLGQTPKVVKHRIRKQRRVEEGRAES